MIILLYFNLFILENPIKYKVPQCEIESISCITSGNYTIQFTRMYGNK